MTQFWRTPNYNRLSMWSWGGRQAEPTGDPILALAGAVCLQALLDVTRGDDSLALDALYFLAEDAPLYFDAMGLESDPLEKIMQLTGRDRDD